jgi:uncharacterized protein (UPF0333 family)
MFRLNKRAQSTLEYAVLVFVIVAALIAMQVYIKRGMQGRIRSSTDEIGEQYSSGHTQTVSSTGRFSQTKETFGIDGEGITNRKFIQDDTARTSNEVVAGSKEEPIP